MKEEGAEADLLDRIAADGAFGLSEQELEALMDARRFVGRAPEQVLRFLEEWVEPALARAEDGAEALAEPDVRV